MKNYEYIGEQEWPGHESVKLYTILVPTHPSYKSTVSEMTLRKLGLWEEN